MAKVTLNASYDAIVIGAGHNGLSVATRLAQDGLRTLVVERAARVGGLAVTDEALSPGFRHHAHANALSYQDLIAGSDAIDLTRDGLETMAPKAQLGLVFRDGRPPLVLYRRDLTELSVRSLRRYSYRDAKMFAQLKARADRLTPALREAFFAPPDTVSLERHQQAIAGAYRDLGVQLGSRTARALIDDLFETPEIRALMYLLALEFGASLIDPGGDAAFLGLVMWMIGRRRLPLGGMSQVPALLGQALEHAGGQVMCGAAVTRVRVVDGGVVGVTIDGRGDVDAPLVVSTLGPSPTYRDLLGGEALPGDLAAELARFEAASSPAIGSLRVCLRRPPLYRGAADDADINRCLQVFVGLDPDEVAGHAAEIAQGYLPAPAGVIRINSLWDAGQAPQGFHSAGADCAFPDLRSFDLETLESVRQSYTAAFLDMWRAYASNLDGDAVLACDFQLSDGFERKMLLRPGADQYRTHVAGFYLAGASTYPGGGVHGACAHNAANVIRQDRGA